MIWILAVMVLLLGSGAMIHYGIGQGAATGATVAVFSMLFAVILAGFGYWYRKSRLLGE
jgi:hypothetical protein